MIKENKTPITIAAIQWFLTTLFQIDRFYFSYDYESKIYIQIKILYFLFLVVSWCFCFSVYKKIKLEDVVYIRGCYIFKVYLTCLMILLVVLWPGTWSWDDLWGLNAIQYYTNLNPWQHIITSYYQDILLQILPFPGGIILLQNIIISICVAFVVTKLEVSFEIRKLKFPIIDTIVKLAPFFLPPVLMYQFSGYRIGLYVYLELTMLVMLICAIKDDKEWSKTYLALFCFLCVITASWRTESFFYIPFSCLLILLIKKNIIPNSKKEICIIALVVGFMGINKLQNDALGNSNYEVISLLRPCAELVRAADIREDKKLLNEIDKVASLEVIHNNPTANGEALYWNCGVVRYDYTYEDYESFVKAFIKLCFKYPKVVIAERWNLFIGGSGITGSSSTNIGNSSALFDEGNGNRAAEAVLNREWFANIPVFKNMRKNLINILGLRKKDGTFIGALQRVIWNAIIPLIILIYSWIKLLIEKKWYLLLLCTAVLIRVPVVILTEPAGWIMYLLSFYFLGYVYFVYRLLIFRSKKTK